MTTREIAQAMCDQMQELDSDSLRESVNHPRHYKTGKFECIDVMEELFGECAIENFCVCNAFKYLWRYQRKNGLEDLEKARWYLNKAIELADNSGKC